MTFGSRLRHMRARRNPTTENLWPDATEAHAGSAADTDAIAIGDAPSRQRVRVAGKVKAVRVQPFAGVAGVRATLVDDTGQLSILFVGRRQLAGVEPGRKLLAEGVIVEQYGKRTMLNPVYRLL